MKENKVISIIFPGNPHPFKFETIEEAIAFTMNRLDYIKEEEIIKETIDKLFNDEPEEKEYTEETKYSGLDESTFIALGSLFHKFMECSGASREELLILIRHLKEAQNQKEKCLSSILEKRKSLNTDLNQILN